MTDRGKIAALLLVLGAGLAVVGSFEDTYRTVYHNGSGPDQTFTTTMWIVSSDPPDGPQSPAYYAVGWPLIAAAVVMVVAAVLTLRHRTAPIGKAVALGAAGVLAGVVLTYWFQVRHEEEIISTWPAQGGPQAVLSVLAGMYLLIAGAMTGLVGAGLAQRKQEPQQAEEDDVVVVHQLDNDDDTPPFGIAMPEQEQETR